MGKLQPAKEFSFCNKVDLHAVDDNLNIQLISSIIDEHNFRGIVVKPNDIINVRKYIKPHISKAKVISIVDYPYGDSLTTSRVNTIHDLKKMGANEIEIVAPYSLIKNKQFLKIDRDIKSIIETTNELKISFKYIIDNNFHVLDDGILTRLYRILFNNNIETISDSLSYNLNIPLNYDSHSDRILNMRRLKSKCDSKIKCTLDEVDIQTLALYPKAGSEIIGLPWQIAPNIIHSYEYKKKKKTDLYN